MSWLPPCRDLGEGKRKGAAAFPESTWLLTSVSDTGQTASTPWLGGISCLLLGRHLSQKRGILDLFSPPRDLGLAEHAICTKSKRQQKASSWSLPTLSHCDLWQITFALHKSLCLCTAEWLTIFNVLWQGRLGLEPFGPAARSLLACSVVWDFLLSVAGDIPRFLRCLCALKRGTAAVTRDAQSILYGSAVVMLHVGVGGKRIYCWVRCICLTLALGPVTTLPSLVRWVVSTTRSLLSPSVTPCKQTGRDLASRKQRGLQTALTS